VYCMQLCVVYDRSGGKSHSIARDRNRNRNLKTSKALPNSQAHQLIHERCDESKGRFPRGGQEKLRFPEGQSINHVLFIHNQNDIPHLVYSCVD